MTKQEYDEERGSTKQSYELAVKKLNTKFVVENSRYKLGDIIKDRTGKIIIESYGVAFGHLCFYPEAVYFGTSLRKDNVPKKSGEKRNIFESNIIVDEVKK